MAFLIDIQKEFPGFSLDLSLSGPGSSVTGLLGASGSGKTMTLHCISGILEPDKGKIVVDGVTFFDREQGISLRPQERRCGYLMQNYGLFPNMTVRQNIAAGCRGARMQELFSEEKKRGASWGRRFGFFSLLKEEDLQATEEMIRKMRLQGLEDRKPCELSGGQQQRCALGRILAGSPRILLLDEPYSALDEYLRDQLMEETLEILDEFHKSVLFVSHSRVEALRMCDRLAVIHEGRILEEGESSEVFRHPKTAWGAILTGQYR